MNSANRFETVSGSGGQSPSSRPHLPLAIPGLVLLLLALGGLALRAGLFLGRARLAIASPFGIDYGEGIVWQQALLMHPGTMYGQIDRLPYIVFHYPPLYHFSVLLLGSASGADLLATGRAISVGATVLIALMAGWLAWRNAGVGGGARLLGALIAATAPFGCWPIYQWAVLMRVDMLAAFFSLLGVCLGIAALRRPGLLYAAMVCFVAAVFTKQTELVAPLAVLAVHLRRRPARRSERVIQTSGEAASGHHALWAILFGAVLALAALAAMMVASDGGFLRHIIGYNINRMVLSNALFLLGTQFGEISLLVVAAVGVWCAWPARVRGDDAAAERAILVLLLGLNLPMLATIGKSGGNINYFIDFYIAAAPFVGIAAAAAAARLLAPRSDGHARLGPVAALAIPLLILAELKIGYLPPNIFARPEIVARNEAILERFRAASGPILADDMVLLLRAGKHVELEPSIFAELGAKGRWDGNRLIALIQAHHFALIQTDRALDQGIMLARYTPRVRAAIEANYTVAERFERRFIYSPAPEAGK